MIRKFLLSLSTLLSIAVTTASAGPQLSQTSYQLKAPFGDANYQLDLKTLLKDFGTPPRSWSISPASAKPPWMTLDSAGERWFGTPQPRQSWTFNLSVADKDAGSFAQVTLTVVAPPVFTADDIDLGIIKEEQKNWTYDLKKHLQSSSAGLTNTFSSPNLAQKAPWMKLDSSTGVLSGEPKRVNVGPFSGITFVVTNADGSDSLTAKGEVTLTPHPPFWKGNPIALQDAPEKQPYSFNVNTAAYIDNQEGLALTFSKEAGPTWLNITSAGVIQGTPPTLAAGLNEIRVKFTSESFHGNIYTQSTVFRIQVVLVNESPIWLSVPLRLPDAGHGVALTAELSQSVTDPDGDKLTFKKISGPAWGSVDPVTGKLTGTPPKSAIGENKFVVSASDGEFAPENDILVLVFKSNEGPTWNVKPTVLGEAKEDFVFSVDLTKHATDPDNDPMEFKQLSGPTWLTISPAGSLTGTPKKSDAGLTKISVSVTDNISGNPADITDILIDVKATNHAPYWVMNPIIFNVDEDAPFQLSVKPFAKDDDGDALTFSAISGEPWAQLSTDGTFTGTPGASEVGDNFFTVRVEDPAGLGANVTVNIHVNHVNHAPYWTGNPIDLGTVDEDVLFSKSLVEFAKDADLPNDTQKFMMLSVPTWATVSEDGTLSGIPKRANLGLNVFTVSVVDSAGASSTTKFHVTVNKVNKAPYWRQDPIELGMVFEESQYQFDLRPYAVDPDGDPLTFALVSGPNWMTVTPDGFIKGTPKRPGGPFTAQITVSDNIAAPVPAGVTGELVEVPHAPEIGDLTFTVKERSTLNEDLKTRIFDPEGDAFTCQLLGVSPWVTLSSDCLLVANPVHEHIGTHKFPMRARDAGGLFADGEITITVTRDPQDPYWIEDPIRFEAKSNIAFSETLEGKAKDPDNWPLTYSKVSYSGPGDDWLTIAANGQLTGTPKDANIGEASWQVQACNDGKCAPATLIINVIPGREIKRIVVGTPVPGAQSENIWVVDASDQNCPLAMAAYDCIHCYYDEVNKNKIHHTGVYLSSDYDLHRANPIYTTQTLIKWTDPDNSHDWRVRTQKAWSKCNICNTPIWTMYAFYKKYPVIPEFNLSGVPLEVMIISDQPDHYAAYSSNPSWKAADFARYLKNEYGAKNKPYRINAISHRCPTDPANSTAYYSATNETAGKCYIPNSNFSNVGAALKDYGKEVSLRANIVAKREITLDPPPIETTTLKVSLAGRNLVGNTGTATDKWSFVAPNTIVMHWEKIYLRDIKATDELVIEYRVNRLRNKLLALLPW